MRCMEIDLSRYRVIHGDKVLNAVALVGVEMGGTDDWEHRDIIVKPRLIIPMVSGDCVADDCGYLLSRFGKAEIGEIYVHDEKVYIRDEDDWDSVLEEVFAFDEIEKLSDEEAKKKVDNLNWKRGIIVYIEAD